MVTRVRMAWQIRHGSRASYRGSFCAVAGAEAGMLPDRYLFTGVGLDKWSGNL